MDRQAYRQAETYMHRQTGRQTETDAQRQTFGWTHKKGQTEHTECMILSFSLLSVLRVRSPVPEAHDK